MESTTVAHKPRKAGSDTTLIHKREEKERERETKGRRE